MVVRYADLISGFFGTYSDTLRRSGFWILRYLWWYATPIWFRDSSLPMVIRYADLVPGFLNIYGGTLCRFGCWLLRYLWWYAVPIWFLDSTIFMVVCCADLVPVFWILDPLMFLWCMLPFHAPAFFLSSCRLEASARGRWHRAGLLRRRGDYYLGCGRRRYCGRVCCLSRRRVLALPQCF